MFNNCIDTGSPEDFTIQAGFVIELVERLKPEEAAASCTSRDNAQPQLPDQSNASNSAASAEAAACSDEEDEARTSDGAGAAAHSYTADAPKPPSKTGASRRFVHIYHIRMKARR